MENATKALLIAGGLMITIIVISIFVLGYNNITHLEQLKLDEEIIREVEEFNRPYLSFNKKVMYGTDVISVLNFAINNNKINNVRFGEELYVEVVFKLKDTIQDKVYLYTLQPDSTYKSELNSKTTALYGASSFAFESGNIYSIETNFKEITEFLQTANNAEETRMNLETKGSTVTKYTIKYSGIADFKRKTFKCSKIEYDSYGRIKHIRFDQV